MVRRLGWEAREEALEALRPLLQRDAFRSSESALVAIAQSLRDREALVRIVALELCSDFKLRVLGPSVVGLLRDPDALVRGYAAFALGSIGGYVVELKRAFRAEKDDTARVRLAYALLGKRGFTKGRLLSFSASKDYRVRISAIKLSSELKLTSRWFEKRLHKLVSTDGVAVREAAKKRLAELATTRKTKSSLV